MILLLHGDLLLRVQSLVRLLLRTYWLRLCRLLLMIEGHLRLLLVAASGRRWKRRASLELSTALWLRWAWLLWLDLILPVLSRLVGICEELLLRVFLIALHYFLDNVGQILVENSIY